MFICMFGGGGCCGGWEPPTALELSSELSVLLVGRMGDLDLGFVVVLGLG